MPFDNLPIELQEELKIESAWFISSLKSDDVQYMRDSGYTDIEVFVKFVQEDTSPNIDCGEFHYEISSFETASGNPQVSSISESLYNAIV